MIEKCNVLMLKSENTDMMTFLKSRFKNKLHLPIAGGEYRRLTKEGYEPQHLFIISNNGKLKEGDLCYYYKNDSIFGITEEIYQIEKFTPEYGETLCISTTGITFSTLFCKKIISTSDKLIVDKINNASNILSRNFHSSTYLDLIPYEFIQKYVENYNLNNIIKNVDIEYEYFFNKKSCFITMCYKYDIEKRDTCLGMCETKRIKEIL